MVKKVWLLRAWVGLCPSNVHAVLAALQRRTVLPSFPFTLYLSSPLSISTSPFFLHLPLFHTPTSLCVCVVLPILSFQSDFFQHVTLMISEWWRLLWNLLGLRLWPSHSHAWQNCNRLSCVVENLLTLQQKIYKYVVHQGIVPPTLKCITSKWHLMDMAMYINNNVSIVKCVNTL